MATMNAPYVFISYSRKQYFIAKKLTESLQFRSLVAWLDVEQISPGDDWQASIDRGLQYCQAVIVVASRASYRSAAVRYEVDTARSAGKPVYLLVIERCKFVAELAGSATIIDCRSNFPAAVARLSKCLTSGQRIVEPVGQAGPLRWMRLPLGQTKLTQLLLLNACFLLATISWMSRVQVTLHWPINPRIVPYLVMAFTLVALWFLSFGYSVFLLIAFRSQRRVSFLELDLWPLLCIFVLPMLSVFLTLRFQTADFVSVPGFGDFFNTYFSVQYRNDTISQLFTLSFIGSVGLFYIYLRYSYLGRAVGVTAIVCALFILPSDIPAIVSTVLILVIVGGIAIWMLRETLTGHTMPIAFGTRDQRLARLSEWLPSSESVWGMRSATGDDDRAWGYWLSPGAFFLDPLSLVQSSRVAASIPAAHGKTWRLHYLPADRRAAQSIRRLLAQQPSLREVSDGGASYEIAILSNRTPRQWIEALASRYPQLIGVIISSIDIASLPRALHQNQWIDYRQQRPEPIHRLAAVIDGKSEPTTTSTPEDFIRPQGPYPLKLVSHALRISGIVALILGGATLIIQRMYPVGLVPVPLSVFAVVLGLWTVWAGARILARDITFAELCALLALHLINAGLWVSLGGLALLPRSSRISVGRYNESLAVGVGFIAAVIAFPLVLFLLFGLIELLLHLRAFFAWLPTTPFASKRHTLAVRPWRQLDFAYVVYLLSCGILIATLVGDSPARYAPIHEFNVPGSSWTIDSFAAGPDDNIWFASYTRSSTQAFGQDYAFGYMTKGGSMHVNQIKLPIPPICSALVTEVCPVYFGKDGFLGYLSRAGQFNFTDPPFLTWLTTTGASKRMQLPADALYTSAIFDGAGNLWYMREISKTEVAMARMDKQGTVTEYPYEPTADIVAGRDGSIWLNDSLTRSIIHIRADGVVHAYAIPQLPTFGLAQLKLGPDDSIWFYEVHSGRVGHLLPSGEVTWFPIGFPENPALLRVGTHNVVWLYYPDRFIATYLTATSPAKSFTLHMPMTHAFSFTVGGDGSLYFSLKNQIGVATRRGEQRLYEIPTLNAEVHELITGPEGTVWFSEVPPAASVERWSMIGEVEL